MDADEVYRALAQALRRANEARERSNKELAEVRAGLAQLITVLSGQGVLNAGHQRLIEKMSGRAAAGGPPSVRLRQYVDKYAVPGGDIDCAARLHLCHARCCAFSFELTTQDLDEGGVLWEVEEPYVIRHEADGWCSHLDRGSRGCTIYLTRPAACRGFDCRNDRRVWIDFEARIAAPLPDGLVAPASAASKAPT